MPMVDEGALLSRKWTSDQEALGVRLEQLRERSAEAWGYLYDQLAPRIYGLALALLPGDPETAEEVVVETMADAARDIMRFDPRRSSLSAWVYGIARRRVRMEIRRRRRRKSVPASAQVSMEVIGETSDGRDIAASVSARLDAEREVSELRSVLSDAEMEVLVLSCIEGLSVREIGQVVRRSEQAVHSVLYRARQRARVRLVSDAGR
jgi:RNA polymerase sigma factor (sigma-70 family)